jgi:hypothetical protein
VTGLTVVKVHHRIAGLVVHFSGSVSSGAAGNTANYAIRLLRLGRRTTHGSPMHDTGKTLPIHSAAYDPNGHSVTLTFGSRLTANEWIELRVNGGQGGISDPAGTALNSPSHSIVGHDYVTTVNPRAL